MDADLYNVLNNDFFFFCARTFLDRIYDNIKPEVVLNDEKFDEVLKTIFIQKIPFLKSVLINNKIFDADILLFPLIKQKSERLLENLEIFLQENLGYANSAKISLYKFKVLNQLEYYILENEEIQKCEERKKENEDKIIKELNSLRLYYNLDEPDNNNQKFYQFFSQFICNMPENFKFEELDKIFIQDLEVEENLIEELKKKGEENKVKYYQMIDSSKKKIGIKRNFTEFNKNNEPGEFEAVVENENICSSKKKRTTIDNYFKKELVFRNVKEKINSQPINTQPTNNNILKQISSASINELSSSSFTPSNLFSYICGNENTNSYFNQSETLNNQITSQNSNLTTTTHNQNTNNKSKLIEGILKGSLAKPQSTNHSSHNSSNLNKNYQNIKICQGVPDNSSTHTSNSNSNMTVVQDSRKNNVNHPLLSQQSEDSMASNNTNLHQPSVRSNSLNVLPMRSGINTMTAGAMPNIIKTRKIKNSNSVSKKGQVKLIDKFFNIVESKVNEESKVVKKESRKKSNAGSNKNTNLNLQKIVHKKFYAKEKELKTPSPLPVTNLKYSKRKLDSNDQVLPETYNDENSNSNNSLINSNGNSNLSNNGNELNKKSNVNTETTSINTNNKSDDKFKDKFEMLKSNYNRTNKKDDKASSNSLNNKVEKFGKAFKHGNKTDKDVTYDNLVYEGKSEDNNVVILTKIHVKGKSKEDSEGESKNKICHTEIKSKNKSELSDDDVLVYSTPTKADPIKFGQKSPYNVSSRMNLLNLFKQYK